MEKSEMLQALISHYSDGNKSQFAKMLGISAQGLSTWIKRNTFDSELIFSKCEYVNPAWLLTGKGSMLKEDSNDVQTALNADREAQTEVARPLPADSTGGIPLIPLSAMAGAFTEDIAVMEYECERYVIPAFKGADFLIQIKGDSMQPTFFSGDLVACQRVPLQDLFFQWNKAYVLDTIQGPLIKRIMPGSDNDHVLIVSDNDKYPPFELHRNQFNGVALVRGLVRLE